MSFDCFCDDAKLDGDGASESDRNAPPVWLARRVRVIDIPGFHFYTDIIPLGVICFFRVERER
jgi:hypothetical protein